MTYSARRTILLKLKIMVELCSYCQRPYGTISTGGRAIYRNFDHIKAHLKINRVGIMCKGTYHDEALNLVQCCNECNTLKGNYSLDELIELTELNNHMASFYEPILKKYRLGEYIQAL